MTINVLVTNLGGTSTKVAYYEDNKEIFNSSVYHHDDELDQFKSIWEQIDYRTESVLNLLEENNIDLHSLTVVSCRPGPTPEVDPGAYEIKQDIIDYSKSFQIVEHPTLIGTSIAKKIAEMAGPDVIAMVYDPESLNEYQDIAKITGSKLIPKIAGGSSLNVREVARRAADALNKPFNESNFTVIHLGSGSTVTGVKNGKLVDVVADDEGPFSVNRVGGQSVKQIIQMCYENTKEEMEKLTRQEGGLYSYLGTSDGVEVEKMIENGNEEAELVFEALAYQASRSAGEMAVAVGGEVDAVILTGGLAHSEMMANWIEKWTSFIAPLFVYPGGFEMEALARGGYRVATGEEPLKDFNIQTNIRI